MGLPVVATDSGGSRELICDGETGYVVRAENPRELASRITQLLMNSEKSATMGRAARRHVEDNLTSSASAAGVTELYRAILAGRYPSRR